MTSRTYFILASTFFMGMLSGAYLYVTVFAPAYDQTGVEVSYDDDAFVIEAQMYGGCVRSGLCASFQLIDGRRYEYLSHTQAEKENGTLPARLGRELRDAFSVAVLQENAQSISPQSCSSYVDGVDYVYRIMREKERYELDTCSTALAYNETLQELLLEAWYVMENPEAAASVDDSFEGSFNPFDWFWDRFHQRQ